jgi:4-amino-4-deoxy-L-arabinose transferase-like glycosyltransferase
MTWNKSLSVLFCLWVAVTSYRFGKTVVGGFRSAFNYGNDIEWLIFWFAIAIVMIILAIAVKRATQIVFWLLIGTCALILILSGTFLAAIIVCAILVVAHVVGCRFLVRFGLEPDFAAVTIPLGFVFLALGGFVLAAMHWLTPLSIGIFLLCLTIAGIYHAVQPLLRSFAAPRLSVAGSSIQLPLLLIAPVIFLNLVWAVAPEIQFDANNYHLAVSKIYLRNHGFIDLPYFFHSYFYHFVEMLFTFGLALRGAAAAKLLSFAFSLIAAAAVFSLGRLVFDERTGIWAAAFFYTTPLTSWLSGTAYIDHAVAMLLTATLIAFLRWHHDREQTGWLYAASLLAGATVAAKMNAAFGLLVMFVFVLWRLRTRPRTLAACAVLALAVAMPWYALTYLWTGNPVLPMLNGIFKSPLWDIQNTVMDANSYGMGASPAALLRLPFNLTWNTIRFGPATPRGGAGIMLLFAFPFAIALFAQKKSSAILFATATLYFLFWAVSFQNARYYVHILPIVCVLGVATIFHFSKVGWTGVINRICCATVLVLQFAPAPIMFWNIPDRFPLSAAFGIETREAFLKRALPSYAGAESLNTAIKPGERVLGIDVEDVRFYLDAPLETVPDSTHNTVLRAAGSLSGERLLYTLTQSGFAYVFATRESMKNPLPWYPYIKPEFLEQFATLIFRDANTAAYRLNR